MGRVLKITTISRKAILSTNQINIEIFVIIWRPVRKSDVNTKIIDIANSFWHLHQSALQLYLYRDLHGKVVTSHNKMKFSYTTLHNSLPYDT